ncbi:acyl-homoserine-lactone synthase [Ponticoccus alexandrii]|uniref:Acyl-homoserine-lactone synthase n=1 Tax=Ponticoccus alexandrii TaxID=1943633 RepID=A0ABX7FG62_9RHOB|nr:acyl-homoserine-lactone synthase [Ponticoccus alexandrii]ETA50027.2 autoinducer synthase [Rhodobacteraceae bacterium PD-2]QRF69044.1 GNAT family N-acetyltransferase [Ponticoccus alexandrii]
MILIIDGLNRHRYTKLLDEMFELRARVFRDRLGWDVKVVDGKEIDEFDALDPAYVLGLDDEGHVVACVRALQTTGPHMLADVFADILDGEPPLRSATMWESTRFCVDTERLSGGKSRNSVSYATCELMTGALEYAKESGIEDIVTVIDPIMNRVLKRSDCAPYDYVGSTKPMGKTSAMAALLDCTDERIDRIRAFAGIEGDVFMDSQAAKALEDGVTPVVLDERRPRKPAARPAVSAEMLQDWCNEQLQEAASVQDREAARELMSTLETAGMIPGNRLKAKRA